MSVGRTIGTERSFPFAGSNPAARISASALPKTREVEGRPILGKQL